MAELGLVGDGPNSYQVLRPSISQVTMEERLSLDLMYQFLLLYIVVDVCVVFILWGFGTAAQISVARRQLVTGPSGTSINLRADGIWAAYELPQARANVVGLFVLVDACALEISD